MDEIDRLDVRAINFLGLVGRKGFDHINNPERNGLPQEPFPTLF